ncbi:response regulator [Bacteriovoracales bacterium]|nr:response regulator [Bacteriovoracales bacterium]
MLAILVVDDERSIVEMLEEVIEEDQDCFVDRCESSTLASFMTKGTKYQLIILDFRMPHKNGGEVADAIRSNDGPNKETPILFISAYMDEVKERTEDLKNVHYLNKPLEIKSLMPTIYNITGKSSG